MKRRSFLQVLAAASAALAVKPLAGREAIKETKKVARFDAPKTPPKDPLKGMHQEEVAKAHESLHDFMDTNLVIIHNGEIIAYASRESEVVDLTTEREMIDVSSLDEGYHSYAVPMGRQETNMTLTKLHGDGNMLKEVFKDSSIVGVQIIVEDNMVTCDALLSGFGFTTGITDHMRFDLTLRVIGAVTIEPKPLNDDNKKSTV